MNYNSTHWTSRVGLTVFLVSGAILLVLSGLAYTKMLFFTNPTEEEIVGKVKEVVPPVELTFDEQLLDKTLLEKTDIKSTAIVDNDYSGIHTFDEYGITFEIVGDVNKIKSDTEYGVEVFVRAWRDNKLIGFGDDGSVEIERFIIYNPPVLVPDPNGKITRTSDKVFETDEVTITRYREDPKGALLKVIAHNISLVGKDTTPTLGKVGNTTTTFYPVAGANSPVDGWCWNDSAQNSWTAIHDSTTCTVLNNNASILAPLIQTGAATGKTKGILRSFITFDTSSISPDTVDSATISLYMLAANRSDAISTGPNSFTVTKSTGLASSDDIVVGDYDAVDNPTGASADITTAIAYADITTGAYNDFVLNSTGYEHIDTSSISYFSYRQSSWDADDVDPNTSSTQIDRQDASSADESGTTQDPKLVVVHSAGAPAGGYKPKSQGIMF